MLLDRLPLSSALMEARLDDPEVAALVAAQPEKESRRRPALRDFTPEVATLYDICDRLGEVVAAVIAAAGEKPPKIQPLLRPITGVERARIAVEKQKHLDLVDDVMAAQARWKLAHPEADK